MVLIHIHSTAAAAGSYVDFCASSPDQGGQELLLKVRWITKRNFLDKDTESEDFAKFEGYVRELEGPCAFVCLLGLDLEC